jgi:uncharacterized protein (DUF1015 family)
MTYRSVAEIDGLVERGTGGDPLYDFTAEDGVGHTLWRVTDTAAFIKAFQSVPALYIADGHHRAAGASRVREAMAARADGLTGEEECNFFLTVIFPSDQLRILAYNRYVSDLGGLRPADFMKKVEERFRLRRGGPEPAVKGEFGMYLEGAWYTLTPKEKSGPVDKTAPAGSERSPAARLDLTAFQARLLEPFLGIADQKKDSRIQFVGGGDSPRKLQTMVDQAGGAAFTLHPVGVEELLAVADAGEIMPPKSTWFSPKLRSGLLVHRF